MTRTQRSEQNRRWRLKNPGYHLKNYARNREAILRRNAEYHKRIHAERLDYWKRRNADPAIKARRKPHIKISEMPKEEVARIREYRRAYSLKHAAELRAYWKAYRKSHPEKTKAHNKANWHRRRAKIASATVNLNQIKEWMAGILDKPFTRCYYCDRRISTKRLHFDHIIPLCSGGPHSVENLCTSCPSCNLNKQRKPIQEWMRLGQQILAL